MKLEPCNLAATFVRPGWAMCVGLLATLPQLAIAGGATDGSVGAIQTFSGRFEIPQELGSVKGANLFHSFARFGIDANESATFTTSDSAIKNVISRVTGGDPSLIHGLLRLDAAAGSRPEFYFINPAGVVFGAGAQIDVPAGFHVSTAQKLQFSDGFAWDTGNPTNSRLTVAAPEAFGFVSANTVAVQFNGASIAPQPRMDVNVVAADVAIDATSISLTDANLRVVAVGNGPIDVPIAGPIAASLSGTVFANNSSELSTTSTGSMFIQAGRVTLSQATLKSTNSTDLLAGPITIIGHELVFEESVISGSTLESGTAADIQIRGRSMLLDGRGNFAQIDTQAAGSNAKTGAIDIDLTGDLMIRDAAFVWAMASGTAESKNINVRASNATISGIAGINSSAESASDAAVRSIEVRLDGTLKVMDGGAISATSNGTASGGTVTISAADVVLSGLGTEISSNSQGFASDAGNAGRVHLTARGTGTLSLFDGALVRADSFGAGAVGQIGIDAGNILIDGRGVFTGISAARSAPERAEPGNIALTVAGDMSIRNGGAIIANTSGDGGGGSIDVHARSLGIDGAGLADTFTGIAANQDTLSSGDAGSISIEVGRLAVSNLGKISAETSGVGNGGALSISADSISITSDGVDPSSPFTGATLTGITAITFGSGAGGPIDIETGSFVATGTRAGVFANAGARSDGQTGSVTLHASKRVSLSNAATLSILNSARDGSRNQTPTNLSVFTPRLDLLNGGVISAETRGSVDGSNVRLASLTPGGLLELHSDGSGRVTTSTRMPTHQELAAEELTEPLPQHGTGSAGSIDVRAGDLILSNVELVSQAQPDATGAAGRVSVNVGGTLTVRESARISTDTAGTGDAGSVFITAREFLLDNSELLSSTRPLSRGNGGAIAVSVEEELIVSNESVLSTSTEGGGSAGAIEITAGSLEVRNASIRAIAGDRSAGQIGSITIAGARSVLMTDRAVASIQNEAQGITTAEAIAGRALPAAGSIAGVLSVAAPEITLDGARLNASSLGPNPAGGLRLNATHLTLRNATLATTAQVGDGGDISIDASRMITVDRSQVTTSVLGSRRGNGGSIRLKAQTLLMDTGFIQANTAAPLASGGDVTVDAGTVVASGTLQVGGNTPLNFDPNLAGFNVIQAASPTGVSGNISVNGPIVDAAKTLLELPASHQDSALARDPCQSGPSSSLTRTGTGAARASNTTWFRIESEGARRASLNSAVSHLKTCRGAN